MVVVQAFAGFVRKLLSFIDVAIRFRQDTQHQIGATRESARIALLHHFALNTYRDLAINLDLAHVKNRPTSQRARYSRCRLIRCRRKHRLAATHSQWMATPAFLQAATATSDPLRVVVVNTSRSWINKYELLKRGQASVARELFAPVISRSGRR